MYTFAFTLWLRIHDQRMGAARFVGVADLHEDAVALIVILAVAVCFFQQHLCVADLTSNPTARHSLEVCARSERLYAKLLHGDGLFDIVEMPLEVNTQRGLPGGPADLASQKTTCLQYLVIAAPRGCSLLFSAVPTTARSRERGILLPSTTILTWTTSGEPYVIVPVLSNTTD